MNSAMLRALEEGDFRTAARLHRECFKHLPPPLNDEQSEATMHIARTAIPLVSFRARAYSHAWLSERGLPSQLPDELKPKAERLYPRIVEAVFVSANSNSAAMKPVAKLVQDAMCDAVEDAYADGRREPDFVRDRMLEARRKTLRALIG